MMSRGNMGKQIATAPASKMTGMDRAAAVAAPQSAVVRMAKGGSVTRGDGACKKGKTKGKVY